MSNPLSRCFAYGLLLVVLTSLPSCKKKEVEALQEAPPDTSGIPAEAIVLPPREAAGKLGFLAKLPLDTEAYVGTLNLPAHLDALKGSTWAKEVNAFLDDKTPAPSAVQGDAPDLRNALAQLWGRDFFVSVGKGGAKALSTWQQLSTIQSELSGLAYAQGYTGAVVKEGDSAAVNVVQQLLGSLDLLTRCGDLVTQAELPPLMLGIQTEKPDEVLKQLVPDDLLKQLKTKARVSQVTIGGSGRFTLIEGTLASVLTDAMKKEALAKVPADRKEVQALVAKALDDLQKKTFALAYGSADGYLLVAVGATRPNFEFVADPAKSLLSRAELSFIQPHAGKNLVAVGFAQADVLEALRQEESITAVARGAVAGLKEHPMFGGMAKQIEPKIAELSKLERDLAGKKLTTATGIAWWDKGLHMETKGGQSTEGLKPDMALKFSPLLADESTVVGVVYQGNPESSAKLRKVVEGWSSVLHEGAHELVKAGLGGKDGPEIAKWVDSDIVPKAVDFYTGSKTLFEKGTGDEHAWIIDLGGKVPPLPIFPTKPDAPAPKMLRLAALDDVTDRKVIAANWDKMQTSLNSVAAAFPLLAGAKLPEPETRNQPGGLSSYAYTFLPGVDDLVPVASVSDKVLMIGTSSSQHGELSTRLIKAKPDTTPSIAQWRINFAAIREAVKTFSTTNATPTNADQMKSTVKWLAPLGAATGRAWIEAGNVRHSITIEVKDVLRYD